MPSPNSNLVTPSTPSTVYDIDGNVYGIVTIGSQVWMNENLKTTKYNDGFTIPNIADEQEWYVSFNGASCDYDNNAINSDIYGKLYNWYTVASTNPKNVCPAGWHVPSDEEWTVLINFLGGVSIAGANSKNQVLLIGQILIPELPTKLVLLPSRVEVVSMEVTSMTLVAQASIGRLQKIMQQQPCSNFFFTIPAL
ncbi:MAG: fibrobacter succinogenes major paralogous domain-containing protein [Bacteroidales bacterium]|nr:fibrobacter succinogenes major paralogous domain-containing protein [Bacteroidales bacterium]